MLSPLRRLLGFRLATVAAVDALGALAAASAGSLLAASSVPFALAPIALGLLIVAGAYQLDSLTKIRIVVFRIVAVSLIGAGAALGETSGMLEPATARAALAFVCSAALLLPLLSLGYRSLLGRPGFEQLVLILGSDVLAAAVARNVSRARPLGLRVAGYLSDGFEREPSPQLGCRLGAHTDFEKVVRAFVVHRVVVSPAALETMDTDGLLAARLSGLTIDDASIWYEALCSRVWMGSITRELLLNGDGSDHGMPYRAAKRATDVVVSAVALAFSLPVLALAACAIKLDSKGPILYWQERVGVACRPFPLFKLRTMRQHAELASGPALADLYDPRVTRVGRLLRRTRIDEIPQLWNVLRGDMSIVGPRPERSEFVDRLNQDFELFRFRTAVRPGLTGWAQVHQGYVNQWQDFERKLAYDLFYLKHRSVPMELSILRETMVELMLLKGV
jgi:exopolysaccharide biosynthesis polyprenyl glycosylphosphotransferase